MITSSFTCTSCGDPIPDERSTYGDPGYYFCWSCHWELQGQWRSSYPMYGVAPHTHDLSRTGTFIGSTVLSALPPADATGWIDCTFMGPPWVGVGFKPDPDAPGLGTYDLLVDVAQHGAFALTTV